MKKLDQPIPGNMTIQYFPDSIEIAENPPRFIWLPDIDDEARYALQIKGVDAAKGKEFLFSNIKQNFYTPDLCLEPGRYVWSYALWDVSSGKTSSEWSTERAFTVVDGLPQTPALKHEHRYADCDMQRPRLWLRPGELSSMRENVLADPQYCQWSNFVEKSVDPWRNRELIPEPSPYPNNKRVPKLWRQMYIDCQEVFYAVRHLSVAGRILDDAEIIADARRWLLHVASWNPAGTTSREYNDEASFRVASSLAWGYDWLYDYLSAEERAHVRDTLATRMREIVTHVIVRAKIHLFPYDSHAVRALSAIIVPCAIALIGDIPEAQDWLDYAINYYEGPFPPWGGAEGGWAEGPGYWMTAMAYYTEAANLLRKFVGHDFYQRAFFKNTGFFPLYTRSQNAVRTFFCDDSTLGAKPGLKVAHNMRQFAGVAQNPYFQWYFEQVKVSSAGTEMEFYNWGWWNFPFDDLQYLHDYPHVEAREPVDLPVVRHFKDIGWVAIQKNMHLPEEHIQFVTKCSKYGTISHSHGDQSAFVMFAYGEDLAIHSGHYIAHGTPMHLDWRRQTLSKNAILMDGKGQYAGSNKMECRKSSGRVLEVSQREGAHFISMDPTDAYRIETPYLKRYRRDIHFVHDSYFIIVDQVEFKQEAGIQWRLHTLGACDISNRVFRYEGEKAGLTGEFVFNSSGPISLRNIEGFETLQPADYEGLPRHWCIEASTPKALKQTLVTLVTPYAKGRGKRVFHFNDDQGFATNLYFQDDMNRFYTISLPKNF
ncbi:MAG: alginate lyase [Rhodocyclales bacterium]|nr:alginate lyase [Rhodocyclales bacterium]